jgi:hypothetical protein
MAKVRDSPDVDTERSSSRQMQSSVYDFHDWRPSRGCAGERLDWHRWDHGVTKQQPPLTNETMTTAPSRHRGMTATRQTELSVGTDRAFIRRPLRTPAISNLMIAWVALVFE